MLRNKQNKCAYPPNNDVLYYSLGVLFGLLSTLLYLFSLNRLFYQHHHVQVRWKVWKSVVGRGAGSNLMPLTPPWPSEIFNKWEISQIMAGLAVLVSWKILKMCSLIEIFQWKKIEKYSDNVWGRKLILNVKFWDFMTLPTT